MTEKAEFETRQRVFESLNRIDRELRGEAVNRAVYAALLLTDGEVGTSCQLALALARVAGQTLHVKDALASRGEQHNPSGLGTKKYADRVDTALIALHAAEQLIDQTRVDAEVRDAVSPLVALSDRLATPEQSPLIQEAAIVLLCTALRKLPHSERAPVLGIPALRRLRNRTRGVSATRFVQCAALEALALVTGAEVSEDFDSLLSEPQGPDEALIRHRVLQLIPSSRIPADQQRRLISLSATDASEHVRQGGILALLSLAPKDPSAYARIADFALLDSCPRVVGLALVKLALPVHSQRAGAHGSLVRLLGTCCESKDPALHRAALASLHEMTRGSGLLTLRDNTDRALAALIHNTELDMAERAATLAQRLHVEGHSTSLGLLKLLESLSISHPEGQHFTLPVPPALRESDVLRIAYVAAANDLPLQLQRLSSAQYRVFRGEKRGFRLWRLFYELIHFGPDKRQSFLHTHGRLPHRGDSTVPLRQAEVTPTRVPGERRALRGQSWGCFLPRIDDLHASCRVSSGKRLATPFGLLTIQAPPSLLRRWWLRCVLVFRHAQLCELRDRALASEDAKTQASFSRTVHSLGFRYGMSETELVSGRRKLDTFPATASCFFQAVPLPVVLWLEDALQYIVSPSGNTAWHLALIVWLVMVAMMLRSSRVQQRFAQSKKKIPLSIGGWGSRGKSGTERLKSALFQSLHLDVISKTTGCEAMLIWAQRGQPAEELFLYRPYDKATIWEQESAVGYAQRLGAQVFLWECMALNPDFVDILNREWMQDHITTITNAYPDHEDIMGPSGEDVARVIGRFVPHQGTVLSSEDQMQALIRESAAQSESQLIDVDELSADLLPRDLLARFPYQEHPRNIALTLRLAESLGIDRQRALVDIADNVVPDLGVLKTFPVLNYLGRTLTFSNGMSANERAGFLSNWTRLEFASHDCDTSPDTQVIAVLNNRADRVARSRVFADLCARDISLDRLVVIGTNGQGMHSLLLNAAKLEATKLEPPTELPSRSDWLKSVFRRLATPQSAATIRRRLERLLETTTTEVSPHSSRELFAQLDRLELPEMMDELSRANSNWVNQQLEIAQGILKLAPQQSRDTAAQELDTQLRRLLFPWLCFRYCEAKFSSSRTKPSELKPLIEDYFYQIFCEKIVVLEDCDATGDTVLDFVFRQIGPGLHGKVLGCQNIKGTGLDFIYRFMSLQTVHNRLNRLETAPPEREQILAQLASHSDYGLFDCQLVVNRFTFWKESNAEVWTAHREQLETLHQQLQLRRDGLAYTLGRQPARSRWLLLLDFIEPLVDNLDGIRRRKRADHIMQRLIAGQLDTKSASAALRKVVARQKGGWLAGDVLLWLNRIRSALTRISQDS